MLQTNNNYLQTSLNQLNSSASEFHDVVSLSTNALSNLVNVLKTIKYNETNISKSSLVHLKKTGDLLVTKNGDKYKDAIHRVISDSDLNMASIKQNLDRFKLNFSFNANEMTSFLTDTYKQVIENEQQLTNIYESIIKPIENLKKALPKIQENIAQKDAIRENEVIFEHMIVTYLKFEYIIHLLLNTELINGWNVHCEYKIFQLMDDKKCNWQNILPCFSDKYKNYEIKKDVYYYFMPDDSLPNIPNLVINQKHVPLTNEMRKKFDYIAPDIGSILNSFLLHYGDKIKKITSTNILNNYKYPIVPDENDSVFFLTRPFNKSANIDPLLGAGGVVKEGTVVTLNNLVIDSFGNGDFSIKQREPNYLTAFGDVKLGKGGSKKKYNYDDDENDYSEKKYKMNHEQKIRLQSSADTNLKIYSSIVRSLQNIQTLKNSINRENSDHLIEDLISLENYLNIEHQNNVLSGNQKSNMLTEADLTRARNHLNYLKVMNERSHTLDSLLDNYDVMLEKVIACVSRIHSQNQNKLCLENFYIKSNLIIQSVNKIEELITGIKYCTDTFVCKLNEWNDPNAMAGHEIDLVENYNKHFERNAQDSKRIKLKSVKVEDCVEKWYTEKINNIDEANMEIRKKREETKAIIFKYLGDDESVVAEFFRKQKKLSSFNNVNVYLANLSYDETLVYINDLKNVGKNFEDFINYTEIYDVFKKKLDKNMTLEKKKIYVKVICQPFWKKKTLNLT